MPFLGFKVVAGEGIQIDPSKVEAILKMKSSEIKTVTHVRSWLGSLSYYRKFIPSFSDITEPLRELIKGKKKGQNIEQGWAADPKCEISFEALKAALVTAPILVFPDFSRPFIIACDASRNSIGCTLMQLDEDNIERPVAYASRTLSPAEIGYGISEKECLACVWSCRQFRKYIQGSEVIVITDHSALKSLTSKPDLHGRLLRFALELGEYDITVMHRPGVEHLLPDFCSRFGIDEMTTKELRDEMNKLVKNRFEIILDHCELGKGDPSEIIREVFSEKHSAMRMQLLAKGACAGDDLQTSIAEVQENFVNRLRETGKAYTVPPEGSGEFCRMAEVMDMVTAIKESKQTPEQHIESIVAEINNTADIDFATRPPEEAWFDFCCVVTRAATREAKLKDKRLQGKNKVTVHNPNAERGVVKALVPSEEPLVKKSDVREPVPTDAEAKLELPPLSHEKAVVELDEETCKRLDEETIKVIKESQDRDPFAHAMIAYLTRKEVSKTDAYMRRKVLSAEDSFVVHHGVLCRLWYRDPRKRNVIDPVFQVYVPEVLRGAIVDRYHGGHRSGHLSPMKTWQRLRERFYWPGMFTDVHEIVRSCGVCQAKGRRPPKQKIQGHIRSDVPGEVWVMDVLHFPESEKGNKYALTMIDVASRWAYVVPLAKIDSASIVRAVEDRIIGDGINPKLFITDNGSEFKKDFVEFCEIFQIKTRKSVPHHAEGHGTVEAFNRTLADAISHMIAEDGGDWEDNLPWARRAYLSSVHTAIQSGSVGLSPAEAFRGWAVQLPLDVMSAMEHKDHPKDDLALVKAEAAKEKVDKAIRWMKESRIDYERAMEGTRRNQNRRDRKFKVGDKVRKFITTSKSRKDRKVGDDFIGPYIVEEVIKVGGKVSEYRVRREGGRSVERVTIEQIRPYVDSLAKSAPERLAIERAIFEAPSREYEVEKILDEEGSMKRGNKRYLIKWKGYDEHTWEPEALINAPDLITEFHTRKYRSKKAEVATVKSTTTESGVPKKVNHHTLQLDLLDYSPEELLELICEKAKVPLKDIVLFWASPPCRTFSPADCSNITRNNNFRNHDDPRKPPTTTNESKARIAREHDFLVRHIFDFFEYTRDIGIRASRVLENPRGALSCRDYMQPEVLGPQFKKATIDQCVFGRDFRKTTHLWHDIQGYIPRGITGDGRCRGRCGKGEMKNGYFKHFRALAMEPHRGPRGVGSVKDKNAVPSLLLEEILLASVPRKSDLKGKVIIDLCAGFQSWAPVADKFKCKYVAVDIVGDRNRVKYV